MESGPETSSVIGDVIHDVVLADSEVVEVFGANAYVQEGPLTTFFHSGRSRAAIALRAVPEGAAFERVLSSKN